MTGSRLLWQIAIISLPVFFTPVYADYQFTIEWISPGGNIREYWVQSQTDTVWNKFAVIPKSETGETVGYSYTGLVTEPTCFKVLTVLMGWGSFDHGGTVCIDPTKDLPPLECTTEAVTCG